MLFGDSILFKFLYQSSSAAHGGLRGCGIVLVACYDHLLHLQLPGIFKAEQQLLFPVSFPAFRRSDSISDMTAAFQFICQDMMDLDASDQFSVCDTPGKECAGRHRITGVIFPHGPDPVQPFIIILIICQAAASMNLRIAAGKVLPFVLEYLFLHFL